MYSTRCFIAVPVGPPASTAAGRTLAKLKDRVDGVKWTRSDQLHVTVKFLGELDNRDLLEVCNELRRVCADIEPFAASLSGLGTFPKHKPAKIVWGRVETGKETLEKLYQDLDDSLIDLGIPKEGRAYTPHLTLGRVGKNTDLDQLAQAMQDVEPEINSLFDIDEILIYATVREKGGVVYEPIDTVEL